MNDLPEGFDFLGWYSPPEAKRLMDALDSAQIEMWAHFDDGMSSPQAGLISHYGTAAQVLLAVQSDRRSAAVDLHIRLFGDGLPLFSDESMAEEETDPDQLAERSRLVLRLDEVEREASFLVEEVKALAAELARPGIPPLRWNGIQQALTQHQAMAAQLQQEQRELEQALADLDSPFPPTIP